MAEVNERVMALVERELGKDPNVDNAELQRKATDLDPSIGKLTARQFNARYPLQVKRRASNNGGGSKKKSAPKKTRKRRSAPRGPSQSAGVSENGIHNRGVLAEFAREVLENPTADYLAMMEIVDRYAGRLSS